MYVTCNYMGSSHSCIGSFADNDTRFVCRVHVVLQTKIGGHPVG